MFNFFDNQTAGQVTAAVVAGGFTLASFSVVGPDTQHPTGSVTVLLMTAGGSAGTGYRTPVASLAAGKTYVSGLINGHASLATAFKSATVDDGRGTTYTLAQAEAW